jgi:hypothetical protein
MELVRYGWMMWSALDKRPDSSIVQLYLEATTVIILKMLE